MSEILRITNRIVDTRIVPVLHYLATTGAAIIVLSQRPKNTINKPPPSGIRERIRDRWAAVIRRRYCLAVLNIFVEPSAWFV